MIVTSPFSLESLSTRAAACERFVGVELADGALRAKARDVECDAWYILEPSDNAMAVLLVTPDRWLSESIEADLLHTGDTMEELLEDELVDLGYRASSESAIRIEHYRSEDRLYTFRCLMPKGIDEDAIFTWLLAFEAAFHELGDMGGEDEE